MIKDDAVKMRYYGIMLHEVERLSRLITDMLQLSRLQSGTEYMEKSTFNIGELIDDVYQSYRQNAQQKGIHLELDMDEELPDVISDPDRIEQVLVILLDNAMRYAGDGGTIRIGAHQDCNDVHVSVWDSGCGITPEALTFRTRSCKRSSEAHMCARTRCRKPLSTVFPCAIWPRVFPQPRVSGTH